MRTPIRDLTIGAIDQPFLLTSPSIAETKKGDPYLRCTLSDRTGEISCIQWKTGTMPDPGIYHVTGFVEEYQGRLTAKAGSMEPTQGDMAEYTRASPVNLDALAGAFGDLTFSVGGEYGEVVRCIFDDDDIYSRFIDSPAAASNHHAYKHGLLEHTVSMARIAEGIASHYNGMYGEGSVDRDLFVAGALLHDLGKIHELRADEYSTEYTVPGVLVGHIAECVTMIDQACVAVLARKGTRDRLIHMVLSHHGRLEYGSPVTPRLFEAQLLHLVDMIDSRAGMFRDATAGLDAGTLSDWVKPLGGRVLK